VDVENRWLSILNWVFGSGSKMKLVGLFAGINAGNATDAEFAP